MKVTDLEQIATEFSKRKENYMEAKHFDYNKDTEIPIQTKPHIIECDLCRRKFQNVSNLEKHIKENTQNMKLMNVTTAVRHLFQSGGLRSITKCIQP